MVTTKHCCWGESNSDCLLFPVCLSDLMTSRPRSAIAFIAIAFARFYSFPKGIHICGMQVVRNNEPHNFVRVKLQTKTLLIMYFSPGSIAAVEGIFRQSIDHYTNSEFLNLNLSIFALRGLNVAVETILNADTAQKHYFGGCLLICKYSSLICDSSRQSKSRTGSSNEYIFSQKYNGQCDVQVVKGNRNEISIQHTFAGVD